MGILFVNNDVEGNSEKVEGVNAFRGLVNGLILSVVCYGVVIGAGFWVAGMF